LVSFSKTPVLCEGLAIDACIANQANRATDIESIDSLALSLMVKTVNQIQNPINNIDFYFFISPNSMLDNSLNQLISKMLLATNLYANPNTSIYLLVKDKKLIQLLPKFREKYYAEECVGYLLEGNNLIARKLLKKIKRRNYKFLLFIFCYTPFSSFFIKCASYVNKTILLK
jgi:hypothetical protein